MVGPAVLCQRFVERTWPHPCGAELLIERFRAECFQLRDEDFAVAFEQPPAVWPRERCWPEGRWLRFVAQHSNADVDPDECTHPCTEGES